MVIASKSTIHAFLWSVLGVAYFGSRLTQAPEIYDEGLIVSGAVRILHGQIPYRDFDSGYPPAQFYTVAGVFQLFGTNLLVERIWDALWRLAIIGLAVAVARAVAPHQRAKQLPLICVGLVTGASGFRLYPMITAMLPCLAAVWCAVLYLNQRGLRWLLFSGLTAGLAILYRHDLAICVCGSVLLACCYPAVTEPGGRWLRLPAVFVSGVLLVVTLPVLYFWLSVPPDALQYSFISFPKLNLAARYLPLPGPGSLLAWRDFYLPLAVIMVASIALFQVAPSRRPPIMLLLTASIATLVLAMQRADVAHVYPAVVFSMVLLSASLPELQNLRIISALAIFAVSLFYGFLPLIGLLWPGGESAQTAHDRVPANALQSDIARAGPVRLALDQRHAIGYIRSHLSPGKPLYVGTAPHSIVSYNDALFYFLADRPQATRFDMFVPGITTRPAVQLEISKNLREKRTEYVVLFRAPPSHEPNLSSVDSGVGILDGAIALDYTPVAEFGRYAIWRRRELERSVAIIRPHPLGWLSPT